MSFTNIILTKGARSKRLHTAWFHLKFEVGKIWVHKASGVLVRVCFLIWVLVCEYFLGCSHLLEYFLYVCYASIYLLNALICSHFNISIILPLYLLNKWIISLNLSDLPPSPSFPKRYYSLPASWVMHLEFLPLDQTPTSVNWPLIQT